MMNGLRVGRPVLALVIGAAWSCSMPGCAASRTSGDDARQEVATGTTGQIGGIAVREGGTPLADSRVVVASFHFDATGVHAREAIMAFGAGNVPRSDGTDFTFELLGGQDRVLARFGVVDPRRNVVEQQGIVMAPEAVYAARFPFHVESRGIRVLDASGREVARTDLVPVIREFCSQMPRDEVCQQAMRGLR
jgi:hypothetical protein